jgi:hypothetical protein
MGVSAVARSFRMRSAQRILTTRGRRMGGGIVDKRILSLRGKAVDTMRMLMLGHDQHSGSSCYYAFW